jgi:hypothetical protein
VVTHVGATRCIVKCIRSVRVHQPQARHDTGGDGGLVANFRTSLRLNFCVYGDLKVGGCLGSGKAFGATESTAKTVLNVYNFVDH